MVSSKMTQYLLCCVGTPGYFLEFYDVRKTQDQLGCKILLTDNRTGLRNVALMTDFTRDIVGRVPAPLVWCLHCNAVKFLIHWQLVAGSCLGRRTITSINCGTCKVCCTLTGW